MKSFVALILFSALVLVGCQTTPPSSSLVPTVQPTNPPATAVAEAPATVPPATNPPPTSTALPTVGPTNPPATATVESPTVVDLPTAAGTSTANATPSSTKVPPPEVSREFLVGKWIQFDTQAQGNNYLIFDEDGSFRGRHGPSIQEGLLVSRGTFKLDKDELKITDDKDCPDGETYRIKFTTKDHLFFTVLGSTCDNFADDFKRQPNWDRYKEAQ